MKKIFSFVLLAGIIFPNYIFSQRKLEKEKNKILTEGLALYTLILANWTSNDLYYENEFNTDYVKGYLSYKDKDTLKTIFWREIDTSSAEYKAKTYNAVGDTGIGTKQKPKQLNDCRVNVKTFRYAKMNLSRKNCSIDEAEREPSEKEKMYMNFRAMTYKEINSDTSFFKHYQDVSLKAIPMEAGKEMKVYVYSSTLKEGVVPIGGDYILTFNRKEKTLTEKTDLHKDFIFISSQYKGHSYDASKSTQHKHKDDAAEFITPTDIATLLLYKSQIQWDEHHVIAGKYTSIFTLQDRNLTIITTAEFDAIKKRKTKHDEKAKNDEMH